MRALAIIDSQEGSMRRYELHSSKSLKFEKNNMGGVDIINPSGAGRFKVGEISPPWAVDTDGKYMPTEFEISGNVLKQNVSFNGASLPVIADPRITFGRGVYLNLNGVEMNAIRNVYGICMLNLRMHPLVATIIKAACNVGGSALAVAMIPVVVSGGERHGWFLAVTIIFLSTVIRVLYYFWSGRKTPDPREPPGGLPHTNCER